MKPIVDPCFSWPVTALLAAATLAMVLVIYRRRIAHLPTGHRRVLLGLRLLTWAVLMFAMLRPAVEFSETDRKASTLCVITDHSRSMGIKDGPAAISRRDALLKTLKEVEPQLKALAEDTEVRHFEFDKELTPAESRSPEALGEQTAIGETLATLLKLQTQGQHIVALLLSDGAQRALPPFDLDPRAAARQLWDQQIPVHTVGFGASGLTESALDLIAEDLEVSPTVFVKNTVVASAKIRALGAINREVTVRLMVEDPTLLTKPGDPPRMRIASPPIKIEPKQNQQVLPVELTYVAQQPGEFKVTLEVVPLDGEPLITNNSLTTYISVLKGGVNVAYFDKIRHEMTFLKRINESPDIQLDFKPYREGGLGPPTIIEPEWFDPGRYDVYIIGDVPAKAFGTDVLKKLAAAVEQGAGLMMTGGYRSFGPGGYANTPLADLLPVEMRATETQGGKEIDTSLHYPEDQPLQMLPTSAGLSHFVMRIDAPGANLERWKSLQPLKGANKFVGQKRLAVVLAETPEHVPLLITQDVGRARTIAFAGDTTYRWVLWGADEAHQRFWQQTILWLAHKENQGENSVWVKLDGRRFRPGQPVEMTFGARDADKRILPDATFAVEVLGPKDLKQPVTPQKQANETRGRFLNTQQPGEYRVRVAAISGGQSIGTAESRFIVFEQDLELYNPAADLSLLEEISRLTGGTHVPPEQLATFLRDLKQKGLTLDVKKTTVLPLWDNGILLGLFVAALSLEWFARKKRGLV